MGNPNYKFGIYTTWDWRSPSIGIGFCNFGEEKYIFIILLFFEVAIGRTSR